MYKVVPKSNLYSMKPTTNRLKAFLIFFLAPQRPLCPLQEFPSQLLLCLKGSGEGSEREGKPSQGVGEALNAPSMAFKHQSGVLRR